MERSSDDPHLDDSALKKLDNPERVPFMDFKFNAGVRFMEFEKSIREQGGTGGRDGADRQRAV
ncbi:hypothetical protein D3C73_1304000 [compost metagenome]